MSRLTNPPRWQPDAVPSPLGWRHPRTNELLVSIKLDMSQFESSVEEPVVQIEEKKEVVVKAEEKPASTNAILKALDEITPKKKAKKND